MEQKTVCFIFESPIQQNMKTVCLFDEFLKEGYALILCDISYVTNRIAYDTIKTGLLEKDYAMIHVCKSYMELYNVLDQLPQKTLIFTRIQWSLKTYRIYKFMEKKRLKYGYISLNEWNDFLVPYDKKIVYIRRFSLKKIVNSIFVRIPIRILLNKGASFIVCNTRERVYMYRKRYTATKNTKELIIHSNVYEEALGLQSKKKLVTEKYCLWLDSYVPYHLENLKFGIDPGDYYGALRKFFSYIEKEYKLKVIIAAHPKSDYELHSDAYEGFEVIKMNTCLLCRDAEFVITALSMSTMYSLLYRKPMLFIYQDALIDKGMENYLEAIEWLSKEMGVTSINIDHFSYNRDEIDRNMTISDKIYNNKIKEWIKYNYDGDISGESCTVELFRFLGDYIQ